MIWRDDVSHDVMRVLLCMRSYSVIHTVILLFVEVEPCFSSLLLDTQFVFTLGAPYCRRLPSPYSSLYFFMFYHVCADNSSQPGFAATSNVHRCVYSDFCGY